jgi:hypothetical protein
MLFKIPNSKVDRVKKPYSEKTKESEYGSNLQEFFNHSRLLDCGGDRVRKTEEVNSL